MGKARILLCLSHQTGNELSIDQRRLLGHSTKKSGSAGRTPAAASAKNESESITKHRCRSHRSLRWHTDDAESKRGRRWCWMECLHQIVETTLPRANSQHTNQPRLKQKSTVRPDFDEAGRSETRRAASVASARRRSHPEQAHSFCKHVAL